MIPGISTTVFSELPLHAALRSLHAYGWRAFDVATEHLAAIEADANPDRPIEAAQRCLRELSLSAPQAHAHLRADVAASNATERQRHVKRLLRHTEIAARLGVRTVVIHPGGRYDDPARLKPERIRGLNVEAFRRLADHAAEREVRIGIENMGWRRDSTNLAEVFELVEAIDHPAVGVALDTSHINMVGLDVAEAVRASGRSLVATHISDNDGSGDQHRTPGYGAIDWPAAMAAFREMEYHDGFLLEIGDARHQAPALQEFKMRFALKVAEWLVALAAPSDSRQPPEPNAAGGE